MALFSGREEVLEAGRVKLVSAFGPIEVESPVYEFGHTRYYERSMGPRLMKKIVAFEALVDPGTLARTKNDCAALERAFVERFREPERPLNLDPGYLSDKKVVLASTKDRAHRVYLAEGIYGEAALEYREGGFHPFRWTYADYLEPVVLEFFLRLRARFLEKRRATP